MRYAVEQRLRFIDFLLALYGYINRKMIKDYFGVSEQQAILDMKAYMQLAPNNMHYDVQRKAYVRSDTYVRHWK